MRQNIKQHEGNKYLRRIFKVKGTQSGCEDCVLVDVYEVLDAFGIDCPATAHAIKKLLCAGKRGKGDRMSDLNGAMAALNRAIDMEESRESGRTEETLTKVTNAKKEWSKRLGVPIE